MSKSFVQHGRQRTVNMQNVRSLNAMQTVCASTERLTACYGSLLNEIRTVWLSAVRQRFVSLTVVFVQPNKEYYYYYYYHKITN